MTSRLILGVFLAAVLATLHCHDAESVQQDPVETEAEEALLGYLRIDTSNPPGNETAGAKYLQALLAKEGIAAELIGPNPQRQSLYARLRSGSPEKALVLLHHIDVVPVNTAEWTKPAFAGLRSGGYLWGRGALDVKSLGIAQAMAMIDLKRRNVPLKRDVILLAVADEEMGGAVGAQAVLGSRPELFADVGYVLNEGGYNETVVDYVALFGIEVQQKVPLWLRITVKGQSGHAAAPPDDGGPLARLVRILTDIQNIESSYRLTPAVKRHFHEAGKARPVGDARGDYQRTITEPIDPKQAATSLSPGYRALLRDTIAITRITGGSCVNCIPATASADLDIRLIEDTKPEAMLTRIREIVGKRGEVEVVLQGEPGPASPTDTPLFQTLTRVFKSAEPKAVVAPTVSAGTSDSRFFRSRGITAYGIAPFKVNYYDADTVHGNDERIRARFFSEGVRLMRRIVIDFCAKTP